MVAPALPEPQGAAADPDRFVTGQRAGPGTSELASYSVGITAQVDKNGTIHVLDLVRGRWEFPDLVRKIREAAQCHRPKAILIEDQASGTGVQQSPKSDRFPVRPIKPKGDKVMRMRVHTAAMEAGKVLLKKDAPWLDELRTEFLAFPYGKHDDQVDALSQLMTWAEDWRIPKWSVRPMW